MNFDDSFPDFLLSNKVLAKTDFDSIIEFLHTKVEQTMPSSITDLKEKAAFIGYSKGMGGVLLGPDGFKYRESIQSVRANGATPADAAIAVVGDRLQYAIALLCILRHSAVIEPQCDVPCSKQGNIGHFKRNKAGFLYAKKYKEHETPTASSEVHLATDLLQGLFARSANSMSTSGRKTSIGFTLGTRLADMEHALPEQLNSTATHAALGRYLASLMNFIVAPTTPITDAAAFPVEGGVTGLPSLTVASVSAMLRPAADGSVPTGVNEFVSTSLAKKIAKKKASEGDVDVIPLFRGRAPSMSPLDTEGALFSSSGPVVTTTGTGTTDAGGTEESKSSESTGHTADPDPADTGSSKVSRPVMKTDDIDDIAGISVTPPGPKNRRDIFPRAVTAPL